jgi:hypothetical protein
MIALLTFIVRRGALVIYVQRPDIGRNSSAVRRLALSPLPRIARVFHPKDRRRIIAK